MKKEDKCLNISDLMASRVGDFFEVRGKAIAAHDFFYYRLCLPVKLCKTSFAFTGVILADILP